MSWGKIDDKLWGSPKWLATPPRARALWATGVSYCMDQLTDGRVPAHVLKALGGTAHDAADLVRIGFWHTASHDCPRCPAVKVGAFIYHDWLEYQPSRVMILAERAAAAERQKRAREKAKASRDSHAVTHAVTSPVSHGIVTPLVTVPPTRPDPTPIKTRVETSHQSLRSVPPKAANE